MAALPDHPVPEPELSTSPGSGVGAESDLGELAALFSARGGGGLSAEVSAQLALEIVLNEIVEQACLATGATGAAIVLERDGEMVCRASSGANAPVLGASLSSESGLTAECIRTRQVQRCNDAQSDPRADAEASRSLGIRSVMILPLLQGDELAGLLEVFSSEPGAFGDRDELRLTALASRILRNLERANDPLSLPGNAAALSSDIVVRDAASSQSPSSVISSSHISSGDISRGDAAGDAAGTNLRNEEDVPMEIAGRSARTGFDAVSLALGATVLVCAVLLGTLIGVRVGWRRATAIRGQVANSGSSAGVARQSEAQSPGPAQNSGELGTTALAASAPSGAGNVKALEDEKKNAAAPGSVRAAGLKDSVPPPGSLLVYENGKEVFRLPPGAEGQAEAATGTNGSGVPGEVQHASALESAGVVDLPPEAAAGSLVHRVEPQYPEEARQKGIQGPVVLEVRIGRDGAIQDVKLVSGQVLLANAAIAAVKQWRFKPRVRKGQPVEMQTRVTLKFKMPA